MGGLKVVVIVWTVEAGGHDADEVASVLSAVGLAHFDAADFGDGVPLIGGFKRAGEESRFRDGGWGKFGVDAGAAQEKEFGDVINV